MFQRRVADLWRHSADGVSPPVDWAPRYLLDELASLNSDASISDTDLRSHLADLLADKRAQRIPSRPSAIRQRLIEAIRPVRALLVAVVKLPWQAIGEHPVIDPLGELRNQCARGNRHLPDDATAPRLWPAWLEAISGANRERAFRALEVATLFALREAVCNGSVSLVKVPSCAPSFPRVRFLPLFSNLPLHCLDCRRACSNQFPPIHAPHRRRQPIMYSNPLLANLNGKTRC